MRRSSWLDSKALHPQQRFIQPIEIEIAVEVQVFHREQREERPGPAPAKGTFFAPFENTQRSDGVRRRRQRQSPQRQPLRFRSGGELQTSQPRTGDRRNPDEDDHQQKAVHAMNQQSLHNHSGAGVRLPSNTILRLAGPGQASCPPALVAPNADGPALFLVGGTESVCTTPMQNNFFTTLALACVVFWSAGCVSTEK